MSAVASMTDLPKPAATVTVVATKLNRYFQVYTTGPNLYESEYGLGPDGKETFRSTYKAEYAVGSGMNGYSFLIRRGNYLFQAPLSYYSRQNQWELSPGYEFADYGFNRPVVGACVVCHSGQPQMVRKGNGLFRDPPFRELAIGCENCHGPAAAHIAHPGKYIVNPAKLPLRLAQDICMSCHQGGDTRVLLPGKDYSDFRPGRPLNETVLLFRVPLKRDSSAPADLLEHHFSMELSRCYRSSGGRLSCMTCHDPHAQPPPSEAPRYYRVKCLTCHRDASCGIPIGQRLQSGNDCVGCHMPKRDVKVISHSSLTNHRIAKPGEPLPEIAFQQTTPGLSDLVILNRSPNQNGAPALTLLQAYGELMEKNPELKDDYLALLQKLGKELPNNSLVLAAMGRLALRESYPNANTRAIELLSNAIEAGYPSYLTFQDLAEALVQAGRTDDAVKVLKRGIEVAPYTQVLYRSLFQCYLDLKRSPEAKQTVKRYVELFPEDDFMRSLAAQLPPDRGGR